MSEPAAETPEISIVIPVYNEEAILHAAVVDLRERLAPLAWRYEIVLAENGSRDRTADVAAQLERKYPEVRSLHVPEPNYGRALKAGILSARGRFVLCDEIDLCDVDFQSHAVTLLRAGGVDMVIGSKLIGGARDERPLLRHAASVAYTGLLRLLVGFRGTDTHGLKGMVRERLLPVVQACELERDVFASELVVRAYRSELGIVEVPVRVMEKRPPSINLFKRIPSVIENVARLTIAIRSER